MLAFTWLPCLGSGLIGRWIFCWNGLWKVFGGPFLWCQCSGPSQPPRIEIVPLPPFREKIMPKLSLSPGKRGLGFDMFWYQGSIFLTSLLMLRTHSISRLEKTWNVEQPWYFLATAPTKSLEKVRGPTVQPSSKLDFWKEFINVYRYRLAFYEGHAVSFQS